MFYDSLTLVFQLVKILDGENLEKEMETENQKRKSRLCLAEKLCICKSNLRKTLACSY